MIVSPSLHDRVSKDIENAWFCEEDLIRLIFQGSVSAAIETKVCIVYVI